MLLSSRCLPDSVKLKKKILKGQLKVSPLTNVISSLIQGLM